MIRAALAERNGVGRRDHADAVTLYCFSCAGASASTYAHWRRALSPSVLVRPVELPGRGVRMKEALLRDFDQIIDDLSQRLLCEELGRYAFFGHSMGALLAYGCAHSIMDRCGTPPSALIAACSAAPSRRSDARLSALKGDAALIEEMRRLGGTPKEVFEHEELLRLTLDVLAADFAVCASFKYRVRPLLPSRLIVVGGKNDSIAPTALAGWRDEGLHGATITRFEGGHFFFKEKESEFLDFLAERLLEFAEAGEAP
ncbi:MAG: alpha/beta fold hydrolase [Methylocystis sp.]|uniref:thioesterase II family protein n=1 Tax=Methylocystis sp. TaxID=1911079 RepID=UPI00392FE32C